LNTSGERGETSRWQTDGGPKRPVTICTAFTYLAPVPDLVGTAFVLVSSYYIVYFWLHLLIKGALALFVLVSGYVY